jgi:hypothetical protein
VDPFALIIFGSIAGLIVALLLIGRYHPRSGAEVLDWKPTRSVEAEILLEFDDVDQMIEATNERRRKRGEPEITERQIREQVAADLRSSNTRRAEYLDQQDLEQMLAAKNERRRARGLQEISEAEYRARFKGSGD